MEAFYTRNLSTVEDSMAQRAVEGRTRMDRPATVRPRRKADDEQARAAA